MENNIRKHKHNSFDGSELFFLKMENAPLHPSYGALWIWAWFTVDFSEYLVNVTKKMIMGYFELNWYLIYIKYIFLCNYIF